MIKIIVLVMVLMIAADGIFRDGHLLSVFLGQEMYLPFFIKSIYLSIAVIASLLLLHAIIWEFSLHPKPEEKKTEYQLKIEEEEEEAKKEEEKKSLSEKNKDTSGRRYMVN